MVGKEQIVIDQRVTFDELNSLIKVNGERNGQ